MTAHEKMTRGPVTGAAGHDGICPSGRIQPPDAGGVNTRVASS